MLQQLFFISPCVATATVSVVIPVLKSQPVLYKNNLSFSIVANQGACFYLSHLLQGSFTKCHSTFGKPCATLLVNAFYRFSHMFIGKRIFVSNFLGIGELRKRSERLCTIGAYLSCKILAYSAFAPFAAALGASSRVILAVEEPTAKALVHLTLNKWWHLQLVGPQRVGENLYCVVHFSLLPERVGRQQCYPGAEH